MEDVESSYMETDEAVYAAAISGSELAKAIALPNAVSIREELTSAVAQLTFRELASSAQWAAELCSSLRWESSEDDFTPPQLGFTTMSSARGYTSVILAKTHFSTREYARAAHCLQSLPSIEQHPAALFLKGYAQYLSGEKRKEEEMAEVADPLEKCKVANGELRLLEQQLARLHAAGALDGLNLYLYGMVLRGLERNAEAQSVLLESVRQFPCNWSAWLDIIAISSDGASTTTNSSPLENMSQQLPNHWMTWIFKAAMLVELQRNEEAMQVYSILLQRSFPDSSYLLSQLATCYYNMRNFNEAQLRFDELRKKDPFKLTSLDTYSNILYVKEQTAALSLLARQAVKIDKYTPEACCIIGNYYSLKGEHEKSVTYFQRALSLNRQFTPAWILMGHEFMEMKNTPAAIDAYRTAVNINQRDYRAWYGLGQTYELLNLHFYALFYYRRAMTLRPEDARMWCAMAQCYDLMQRKVEALKCYEKAHRCGDRERMALPRLARLHEELGDADQAARYYKHLLEETARDGRQGPRPSGAMSVEAVEALKFLMRYYRQAGDYAQSKSCAEQLLDTQGPEKDEAKAVLRDLRSIAEDGLLAAPGHGQTQAQQGFATVASAWPAPANAAESQNSG
mmetsp:Transcript_58831/g.140283  ORF Transcript_58831/g.140283 Transcript_58831/m.140283 type:complete len:625 (-) Transcript_58831:166-2040(-)